MILLNKNYESWISLEQLGQARPYKKTFCFDNDFINENHKKYSECKTGRLNNPICIDIGIDGWLQRTDALKLYEMAYYTSGNILELGTNRGLSASIMAQALFDRYKDFNNDPALNIFKIYTVEIDKAFYDKAIENLKSVPGSGLIRQECCNADFFIEDLIITGEKFGFIFVDHDHDYNHTKDVILRLDRLLLKDGFVLFHDYIDPMNLTNPGVKVYQAVRDFLITNENFEFFGCFGCTALFRKIK